MKFVNEKNKDAKFEEKKPDQLDIKEIKQPEVAKPEPKLFVVKPSVKAEKWEDGITTTLVNLRETANKNALILDTIKGGELVKISTSFFEDFKKVNYKGKIGFINKDYVRKVVK